MNQFFSNHLPDLVVTVCPFGCNGKCPKVWINEENGHIIICDCTNCHSERVYPEERYTSAIEDEANQVCAPESDAIIEQNVSSRVELTDE